LNTKFQKLQKIIFNKFCWYNICVCKDMSRLDMFASVKNINLLCQKVHYIPEKVLSLSTQTYLLLVTFPPLDTTPNTRRKNKNKSSRSIYMYDFAVRFCTLKAWLSLWKRNGPQSKNQMRFSAVKFRLGEFKNALKKWISKLDV
jgi:hypothetical protein